MFFNFRCILIQQSIQDIRCFAHRAVDDIDPVLFAPVVDVVVERDPTTHAKKAPIVSGVHVGGCHAKANPIGGRGFPVTEKRREGKRSMIGNEMMDRRAQGFRIIGPVRIDYFNDRLFFPWRKERRQAGKIGKGRRGEQFRAS